MDCVRIFTLGGYNEFNSNTLIIEINNDIFIFDVNIKYSFFSGVEYVIADFDYLKKNKNRIKAYIITQCQIEKSIVVSYFIKDCPAPIYCTEITKIFIDFYLKKNNFDTNINYFIIQPNSSIEIFGRIFHFFAICNNVPNSLGVIVETDIGRIVYLNSFVIGNNNFPNFDFNINFVCNFSKNVLILICDSTFSRKEGYTTPNCFLTNFIESNKNQDIINNKLVVSVYYDNIFAIAEIVKFAAKYNRKICFYDSETSELFECLKIINECVISKETILDYNYENNVNTITIIVGSEKNIFHKINNFSKTNLSKNTTFIIASQPNNNLEVFCANTRDNLIKKGFEVVMPKEYVYMHPSVEDLKNIISIFKPKYFLPIKGYYRDMIASAIIANNMNNIHFNYKNIFILENGNVLNIENENASILPNNKNIKTGSILIEGKNIFSHESNIDERIKLAKNGILILNIDIDYKNMRIFSKPQIKTLGFEYSLIKNKNLENVIYNKILFLLQNKLSINNIEKSIVNFLNIFFTKEIKNDAYLHPVIIPIINNTNV